MKMRKKFLYKAVLAGAALAAIQMPNQVEATLASGYIDFVNSYRHDKISTRLNTYDENKNLLAQNRIDLNNISLYQIGTKGQLVACNIFARGEAYWGWSDNGRFREKSNIPGCRTSSSVRAKLHKGRTRDFTVGGGYYLPTCTLFNIGPSGGWSYQSQNFTVHRATYLGDPDDSLNGLRIDNRWEGPWAGVDAQMDFCGFDLRGGYSYHWANWKGKWSLNPKRCDFEDAEDLRFSERCKASNVRGQVAYVDAMWNICPCIELGLGFKWQRWEAKNGKQKHDKADLFNSCNDRVVCRETDKLKSATWESYTVSLNLGIGF